jgi:hypothetical protein
MQSTDGVLTFSRVPGTTGFSVLEDVGKPALPVRVVSVVVPAGRRVEGVEASASHSSVLASA